jgi:hypothetical protein
MPANFFLMLSIVVPGALLIVAVVNDYRSQPRRSRGEGF